MLWNGRIYRFFPIFPASFLYLSIDRYALKAMTNERLYQIIEEELSKSEVNSMIDSKIGSKMDSSDFKKLVKKLAAEVLKNWTRILWQRQSFWSNSVQD